MKLKRWVLVYVLSLGVLTFSGCALFLIGAGVAVGAGSVAYVQGELKAADNVTMDKAWDGSLRAMQDLEFKVTKSQKDALAGEIVARRADGTRIIVRLKKQTDQVTEFGIRVGTFGDEALSRLIYEKVKSHF
jgi:hypothetical protein